MAQLIVVVMLRKMTQQAVANAALISRHGIVHCRSHRRLVEEIEPAEHPDGDTVVLLACLDDDANGQGA
jgi:hypothetical protein